jgi:hypothetical protein
MLKHWSEDKALGNAHGEVSRNWLPLDITWEGFEFIAKIRDESLWKKLKAVSLEKTGGLGYEFIKALGTKVITDVVTVTFPAQRPTS